MHGSPAVSLQLIVKAWSVALQYGERGVEIRIQEHRKCCSDLGGDQFLRESVEILLVQAAQENFCPQLIIRGMVIR